MSEQPRNKGLSTETKIRLMELGLGDGEGAVADQNEEKLDFLCDILNSALPVLKELKDSLPTILHGPGARLESLGGGSLRHRLLSPDTDVDTLGRIKDYAKKQGSGAQTEGERDVFLAVYCMAIAAALSFHHEKISQHTPADLRAFFSKYAGVSWIPPQIRLLFDQAAEYVVGDTHSMT